MMRLRSRPADWTYVGIGSVLVALVVAAAACSSASSGSSASDPAGQASTTAVANTALADVITMPDGFPNLATKCINGERFTVSDSSPATMSVIPADPSCQDSFPAK